MLDCDFKGHFCYYVFITYKLDHLLHALMTFHVGQSHTLEVILILFTHITHLRVSILYPGSLKVF